MGTQPLVEEFYPFTPSRLHIPLYPKFSGGAFLGSGHSLCYRLNIGEGDILTQVAAIRT